MRIDNQTHWRTDHLRAIIQRVMEAELDPEQRRGFKVEVTYNRNKGKGGRASGWAPYHGRMIRLMVPSDTVDRVDLAHCIAHEIAHSRGMRHRQMRGSVQYEWVEGYREFYAWAEGMPLERRPLRPRPSLVERRQDRLEHAREKAALWERRARLAASRAKRWRRRARSIEQVMVRAAQQPEAP